MASIKFLLCSHKSSLEGATELQFAPICSFLHNHVLSQSSSDMLCLLHIIMQGKLARGLSIIDHDMDEENGVVV